MHAALKEVLGEHVQQKGSLVDDQRLRFDFSHSEAVKPEQIKQRLKARFAQVPAERSLADELISERREEGRREVAG